MDSKESPSRKAGGGGFDRGRGRGYPRGSTWSNSNRRHNSQRQTSPNLLEQQARMYGLASGGFGIDPDEHESGDVEFGQRDEEVPCRPTSDPSRDLLHRRPYSFGTRAWGDYGLLEMASVCSDAATTGHILQMRSDASERRLQFLRTPASDNSRHQQEPPQRDYDPNDPGGQMTNVFRDGRELRLDELGSDYFANKERAEEERQKSIIHKPLVWEGDDGSTCHQTQQAIERAINAGDTSFARGNHHPLQANLSPEEVAAAKAAQSQRRIPLLPPRIPDRVYHDLWLPHQARLPSVFD